VNKEIKEGRRMKKKDRLAVAKCEDRRLDFNFLFFRTSFWL
jgi:hypothetical protein